MNKIYGIEPDLCIQNPSLLLNFGKDIILPQYFYDQLKYLKEGNYSEATEAANKIIKSLQPIENPENILAFKAPKNGLIYFIDQEFCSDKSPFIEDQIDLRYPLNRYFLILYKASNLLKTSTVFLVNSSSLIQKCNLLDFSIIDVDNFCCYTESFLSIEIILSIQNDLKPINPISQIEWDDESEVNLQTVDNIYWQDYLS